jgi:hypothetical protein
MTDRIMTLHPAGKAGVNIDKRKYDVMRQTVVETIHQRGEIMFEDLMQATERQLTGKFDGSIGWYTTTVKLDLETRGLLQRVPRSSLQRLRLT